MALPLSCCGHSTRRISNEVALSDKKSDDTGRPARRAALETPESEATAGVCDREGGAGRREPKAVTGSAWVVVDVGGTLSRGVGTRGGAFCVMTASRRNMFGSSFLETVIARARCGAPVVDVRLLRLRGGRERD